MTDWSEIDAFPGYSVSDEGDVRNDRTGRHLVQTKNQGGLVFVGMSRGGVQYKRSVSALVARAFLDAPRFRAYSVTINLNGDREDNHARNLMWRPLQFARRYHQQFMTGPNGINRPIIDIRTRECFDRSWDAAIRYGLIDRDIMMAILNRTVVFPTFQMFRVLEE
jgi:hypothetical protein